MPQIRLIQTRVLCLLSLFARYPVALLPWQRAFCPAQWFGGAALLTWLSVNVLPTAQAQTAATLTTLYNFTGGSDGEAPHGPLVQGRDGNFYGTTALKGINGQGTVFKVTPAGVLTTLYSFTGGDDGGRPFAALVQGSDGNFYGTTALGGTSGESTVFEITPAGALTTLYSFSGYPTPATPSELVQGSDGNFYGTTAEGGTSGNGMVFEITPAGALTTLYSFAGSSDGYEPLGGLVQGSDGNFYGTTSAGGTSGNGTVFEITPAGVLTTLYSFTGGSDGGTPYAALIQGSNGNFYGTASAGGIDGDGTVFEITPAGVLTTLYTFTGGNDGESPINALVQGSDGNFYGATSGNIGTIFEITPAGMLTTLYTFTGGSDGFRVSGALVPSSGGNFYGTAAGNLSSNDGTVFELSVYPAFFTGETALADGVYYLQFPNGNLFGYYEFLSDPNFLYHFDLGFEYVFDANDGQGGVYFYDFTSSDYFYTSPVFPFPYLYDFGLNAFLYYYPDPNNLGHYNTDGIRYFYDFSTGTIIMK